LVEVVCCACVDATRAARGASGARPAVLADSLRRCAATPQSASRTRFLLRTRLIAHAGARDAHGITLRVSELSAQPCGLQRQSKLCKTALTLLPGPPACGRQAQRRASETRAGRTSLQLSQRFAQKTRVALACSCQRAEAKCVDFGTVVHLGRGCSESWARVPLPWPCMACFLLFGSTP